MVSRHEGGWLTQLMGEGDATHVQFCGDISASPHTIGRAACAGRETAGAARRGHDHRTYEDDLCVSCWR